jgi:hypothetical protein
MVGQQAPSADRKKFGWHLSATMKPQKNKKIKQMNPFALCWKFI